MTQASIKKSQAISPIYSNTQRPFERLISCGKNEFYVLIPDFIFLIFSHYPTARQYAPCHAATLHKVHRLRSPSLSRVDEYVYLPRVDEYV